MTYRANTQGNLRKMRYFFCWIAFKQTIRSRGYLLDQVFNEVKIERITIIGGVMRSFVNECSLTLLTKKVMLKKKQPALNYSVSNFYF